MIALSSSPIAHSFPYFQSTKITPSFPQNGLHLLISAVAIASFALLSLLLLDSLYSFYSHKEIDQDLDSLFSPLEFQENPSLPKGSLKEQLKTHYDSFWPKKMNHYLQDLGKWMEKYKEEETLIISCFEEIDQFLNEETDQSKQEEGYGIFWDPLSDLSSPALPERLKKFVPLEELSLIINQHIETLQIHHAELAKRLKIRLANFFLNDSNRASFPDLFLTEKEKAEILSSYFQSKEDKRIQKVIHHLQNEKLTKKDIETLSLFIVNEEGHLSDESLNALKEALIDHTKDEPDDWDQKEGVRKWLKKHFTPSKDDLPLPPTFVKLDHIIKARKFFADQIDLEEEEVQIPSWYHATHYDSVQKIIDSSEIEVRHQGVFMGAWVSIRPEHGFGKGKSCVFAFNSKIPRLDADVAIECEFDNGVRWRGVQKAIPLKGDERVSHLAMIGLHQDFQEEKETVLKQLQEKGMDVPVVSATHIDYLQKHIFKVLGTPNLPKKWWGK